MGRFSGKHRLGKLTTGVALAILHPEVAFRDCRDCLKWLYNERTGRREIDADGQPIPRPPGTRPPCGWPGQSCPKGMPQASKALTPKNEQAYRHYLECKATGHWPHDSIVRRNAGLIRSVEDRLDRRRQQEDAEAILALLGRVSR